MCHTWARTIMQAISCGNLYVLIRGVFDRPTAFSLNDYLKTTLYPAFAHTGLASNVTLRDFYLAFISRSSRSMNKIRIYTPSLAIWMYIYVFWTRDIQANVVLHRSNTNVLQYKIYIIIAIIVYHEKSRKFVESFLLEEKIPFSGIF